MAYGNNPVKVERPKSASCAPFFNKINIQWNT